MQYAISNWIYGDEPLRETFARLARFGYDGVELVGEPERYVRSEVRALCEQFGLAVTSILGWSIWGIPSRDLASPDAPEREAAVRYGKACVDLAAELDARILVVLPAAAGRTSPTGNPRSDNDWHAAYRAEWDYAVQSVRATAGYALDRGVLLALEPINRYETFLVTSLDEALKFVEDVAAENLKLHLDTFHMSIEESDPAAAIRRAGDLLVNMHVSDSNRESPGRGHTDFSALLRALTEIKYRGALTLEPVPPGSDPLLASRMHKHLPLRDMYAEESITHLKAIEASLIRA